MDFATMTKEFTDRHDNSEWLHVRTVKTGVEYYEIQTYVSSTRPVKLVELMFGRSPHATGEVDIIDGYANMLATAKAEQDAYDAGVSELRSIAGWE